MKKGKDFNLDTALLHGAVAATFCALFASPASADITTSMKNGFTSDMAGKSIASITTMGEAQNFAFLQGIARRQNSVHSFSKSVGKSEAFFGDGSGEGDDTVSDVMDGIAKQFGLGDVASMTGGARPQFWSTDFTRKGKVNAAESRETYQYDLNGFAGGLDMKVGTNWMVGFGGGYSRTSSTFESLYDTNTSVDAYHTALYATYEHAAATIDSVVSMTYLATDSERGLNETRQMAEAKASGYQLSWMVSAMGHNTVDNYKITPLAGFTYTSQMNKGMNEQGAGSYNLSTKDSMQHSLRPMLGLDIAREYTIDRGMTLTPEVYGIYRYEMLDSNERVNARLDNFDSFSLNTPSNQLSRHSMMVGGALSFRMGDRFTSKMSFDSDMQPGSHEHKGMFKLSYSW